MSFSHHLKLVLKLTACSALILATALSPISVSHASALHTPTSDDPSTFYYIPVPDTSRTGIIPQVDHSIASWLNDRAELRTYTGLYDVLRDSSGRRFCGWKINWILTNRQNILCQEMDGKCLYFETAARVAYDAVIDRYLQRPVSQIEPRVLEDIICGYAQSNNESRINFFIDRTRTHGMPSTNAFVRAFNCAHENDYNDLAKHIYHQVLASMTTPDDYCLTLSISTASMSGNFTIIDFLLDQRPHLFTQDVIDRVCIFAAANCRNDLVRDLNENTTGRWPLRPSQNAWEQACMELYLRRDHALFRINQQGADEEETAAVPAHTLTPAERQVAAMARVERINPDFRVPATLRSADNVSRCTREEALQAAPSLRLNDGNSTSAAPDSEEQNTTIANAVPSLAIDSHAAHDYPLPGNDEFDTFYDEGTDEYDEGTDDSDNEFDTVNTTFQLFNGILTPARIAEITGGTAGHVPQRGIALEIHTYAKQHKRNFETIKSRTDLSKKIIFRNVITELKQWANERSAETNDPTWRMNVDRSLDDPLLHESRQTLAVAYTFLMQQFRHKRDIWIEGFIGESVKAYLRSAREISCSQGIVERVITAFRGIDPSLDELFAKEEMDLLADKYLCHQFDLSKDVNQMRIAQHLWDNGIRQDTDIPTIKPLFRTYFDTTCNQYYIDSGVAFEGLNKGLQELRKAIVSVFIESYADYIQPKLTLIANRVLIAEQDAAYAESLMADLVITDAVCDATSKIVDSTADIAQVDDVQTTQPISTEELRRLRLQHFEGAAAVTNEEQAPTEKDIDS